MVKEKCTFHEMITILEDGGYAMLPHGEIVFKQVPAFITPEIIDVLKSVPTLVKEKMKENIVANDANGANYIHQYVKMDVNNNITYYIFNGIDINSKEWRCVTNEA